MGIFRSKVVDISDFSIIIEVVGNQGKTTIILNISLTKLLKVDVEEKFRLNENLELILKLYVIFKFL